MHEKPRNIQYVYTPPAQEVQSSKHNVQVLDLTGEQPNPPPKINGVTKHRVYRGKVVSRDPAKVNAITIHQTACTFGKAKHQPTRHHRALHVACHALAFSDGVVALPNPLPWYVYHGNGFNAKSLGLEIEGSFPGLPDDPETPVREDLETHWGDDAKITPVTDLLVHTACVALDELVARAAVWGADIKYIHAHRQSSKSRVSDPGWELWQRVVLDYAVKKLGLRTQPTKVLADGRPIPLAWDPSGQGSYQ